MDTEILTIPADNLQLETELKQKKLQYMDHILFQFKKIIREEQIPAKMSLFKFDKTNLEVIVLKKSYVKSLENLQDYYIKEEEYEKCSIIKDIIKKIVDMSS
jgi:protein-arginine kinase activator protein McsA